METNRHTLFAFLASVAQTDVGRKRKRNEDSLASIPERGVFCVADGMGGEDSGDVASRATVDAVTEAMRRPMSEQDVASVRKKAAVLTEALRGASAWIQKRSVERGRGMSGSTVVVLVFDALAPDQALALHAGDSRIYRYRKGDLVQITRDHSLAEEAGFKSRKDLPKVFRGMVTRGVGIREDLTLEETAVEVREADLFLLCSDGLSGMIPDKRLRKLLRKREESPLEELAQTLVAEANAAGGDDNVSVILVRVGPLKPVEPGSLSAAVPDGDETDTQSGETETADTATPTAPSPGGSPDAAPRAETAETVIRPPPGILSRLFHRGRGAQ